MRSASRILIIIGAVLAFLSLLGLLITGIVFLVLANPEARQTILDGLSNGSITSSFTGSTEEQAQQIQELFKILGIVFIALSAVYLVSPIVSLIASGKNSKGLYILGLVLSVLAFDLFLILGNAFGLADEA